MTRLIRRTLLPLVVLGLLAACSEFDSDIEKVKAAQTTGSINEQLVKDLAGARGSFKWSARKTEKYGKDTGIVLVEARIERTSRGGEVQVVQLQWLHNRETDIIGFEDLLINGQSRGFLGAALEMLLLQLGLE